ncbi:MAG: DUF2271 domain-containing protein [Spirochaetes bacterium]|nr:DUF2271 domain-containing protein [Spirochaetota bacterium]
MKRLLFTLLTALVLTYVTAQQAASQQAAAQQAAAEITFSYTRLSGSASNQFAVWIENAQGQYIKTLYATRYTANGGWKRRESSIPMWVKQSGLSNMTSAQVDAVSGATPKAGTLIYTWDGTDSRGAVAPAGNYIIVLEGTLRWENQVYYRAPIRIGQGPAAATVSVEYKGDPGDDRAMISDVKVRTLR